MSLYETDFYTWSLQQAELIRAHRIDHVDFENIAEEIASLGRDQARKLRSSHRLIAMHLSKLIYQPSLATKRWRQTITRERFYIEGVLDDSPGLKSRRDERFIKAYAAARREAAIETGLPVETFPIDPPFSRHEAEEYDYMP